MITKFWLLKPKHHYTRYKVTITFNTINMKEFDDIIKEPRPTLVDFFATWCGPCKMQSPIIDDVKKTVGDKANVLKVDVDQSRRLSALYQIRSVPTLMIFKDGEPIWRASGVHTKEQLVDKLNEIVDGN